jgi:His/Glu/Gln/Arg/opine family amino acid ABC transporter permease subunit
MDWAALWQYAPLLLDGLRLTIIVSIVGAVLALSFGGLLVASASSGWRPLAIAVRLYTELILGVPFLVLLYVIYFVLPQLGFRLAELPTGLLTITLYYGPYMAEIIRGAVMAVPQGQIEAARTIGMSGLQIAYRVVVPQALGLMIPPLTGICIGLAKDTAILSVISVHELAYATKQVVSRTYAPFEVWTMVALLYWMLLTSFEFGMRSFERRATRYRR